MRNISLLLVLALLMPAPAVAASTLAWPDGIFTEEQADSTAADQIAAEIAAALRGKR